MEQQIQEEKVETIIFCGDLCYPGILKRMAPQFKGQIHLVHGNVADRDSEIKKAEMFEHVTHHGDVGEVELSGKKIAFTHKPDQAEELADISQFDYVFFGHTHHQSQTTVGKTVLLNPGTAGGMFQYPSYAIIDLSSDQIEFKQVTF